MFLSNKFEIARKISWCFPSKKSDSINEEITVNNASLLSKALPKTACSALWLYGKSFFAFLTWGLYSVFAIISYPPQYEL